MEISVGWAMDVQQDDAAVDPAKAGAVLGLLRTVGLVGPKLALQIGEERSLARQVEERLGFPEEEWTVGLIKTQIDSAVSTMEIEARVDGAMATPGVQAVRDAMDYESKRKETKGEVAPGPRPEVIVVIPKRGMMPKQIRKPFRQRDTKDMEEAKVLSVLVAELEMVSAPVLKTIEAVKNQERVRAALLGQYRASTVKRYLAYWQGFRKWIVTTTGRLPVAGAQLVDYLYMREEEGMGPSVPLSISKAVQWFEKTAGWFEKTAGIDEHLGMFADPLAEMVVRDLLEEA